MIGSSATRLTTAHVGRNDPCPCGSGKKFKHCCQAKGAGADFPSPPAESSRLSPALKTKLQALLATAKKHWDAERWAEATAPFAEIARLNPDSPEAHYDLGVCLLRSGRPSEAAATLSRAVDLKPGFRSAQRELALALEQAGRGPEAALAYRRLVRIAGDPLERLRCSARALAMEGRHQEAESELHRLLALAPDDAGARFSLAQLLSNRGKFEEAASHLSQTIDAMPGAFQQFAAARRMTEADRPLIDRMSGLVERSRLNPPASIAIHFGLGKAFDDLGEYAQAMRHYDAGNRLRAASARLDRASVATQFDGIIAGATSEVLARAGESLVNPVRPDDGLPALIVGMPRSGTTLVEQILSSHPDVAAGGELPYWMDRGRNWRASNIGALDGSALSKAAEDYLDMLRRIGPRAIRVTDKEPKNFMVLWLIRLACPGARIIHVRRSPIDTCLSIYFTNLWAHHSFAWDRGDIVFFYRQYERLMEHWRRVLPAERFTEVDYESLVADREAESRRLIAFLGLDWNDACLAPERNQRIVRTASLWQARQPVYKTSVERWRRYEPWLGELRELLPESEAETRQSERNRPE